MFRLLFQALFSIVFLTSAGMRGSWGTQIVTSAKGPTAGTMPPMQFGWKGLNRRSPSQTILPRIHWHQRSGALSRSKIRPCWTPFCR